MAGQEGPSVQISDPLELTVSKEDFNPIEYVNRLFPTGENPVRTPRLVRLLAAFTSLHLLHVQYALAASPRRLWAKMSPSVLKCLVPLPLRELPFLPGAGDPAAPLSDPTG